MKTCHCNCVRNYCEHACCQESGGNKCPVMKAKEEEAKKEKKEEAVHGKCCGRTTGCKEEEAKKEKKEKAVHAKCCCRTTGCKKEACRKVTCCEHACRCKPKEKKHREATKVPGKLRHQACGHEQKKSTTVIAHTAVKPVKKVRFQ
jgi:hypothetical protein